MKTQIEPGCMVMVKRSFAENNGKFAIAIRFVGQPPGYVHNDIWMLDTDMMCEDTLDHTKLYRPYMCERCLLRIDGHEENNHLTETEMKGVYA